MRDARLQIRTKLWPDCVWNSSSVHDTKIGCKHLISGDFRTCSIRNMSLDRPSLSRAQLWPGRKAILISLI